MSEPSTAAAVAPQAPIAPPTAPAASPVASPSSASPAPRAGVIADAAYHGLPPDQQAKYANVKKAGDQGGSEWVARDQLGTNPDPTTTAPGETHKFDGMEFTTQELRDFLTSKADAELRKASLPQSPAEYTAELPADFQLPAGISEFKFDTTDPLFTAAQAWAHARQIDRGMFGEMLGLYASAKATEAAQLNAAHAAEVAKLGANGPLRISALEMFLRGVVGDDRIAGQMKNMLVTNDLVRGMETLQQKFSSQGVASFSQAHREPGNTGGRVSPEVYEKMGPAERLNYARQFDQSQFQRAG